MLSRLKKSLVFLISFCAANTLVDAAGVTYQGGSGVGHGKTIVLVAGDDAEYHSEEALPALAKILAVRHGFTCTVLFSMNPNDGTIDPRAKRNIPGLEALRTADLLILFIRWRDLPDEQMRYFVDYFESGRPIIALRTGTHPFELKTSHTYEKWSWDSQVPDGKAASAVRFWAKPGWLITETMAPRVHALGSRRTPTAALFSAVLTMGRFGVLPIRTRCGCLCFPLAIHCYWGRFFHG